MINLMLGDCLERMKEIPAGSVDLVLTDPPYGTTACKWDSVIPLDKMWDNTLRLVRDDSAILLFASQPFTTILISSNIKCFAYTWVWNKKFAANFVQAKRQPLKDHEDIVVFSKSGKMPRYYPIMTERKQPIFKGGNKSSEAIPIARTNNSDIFTKQKKAYTHKHPTTTSLEFSVRDGRGLHPTQKPIALLEYLIKTYTNEGDTVLDFTMGSGSTGVACRNLNRKFIGIEMDQGYFDIATKRIQESVQ